MESTTGEGPRQALPAKSKGTVHSPMLLHFAYVPEAREPGACATETGRRSFVESFDFTSGEDAIALGTSFGRPL
jgi:hypothetical protein